MFDVIIIGAGGFGREMYHWTNNTLPKAKFRIKGFLDDSPGQLTGFKIGVDILGSIHSKKNIYSIKKQDRFLFAIGSIDNKKEAISSLKKRGAQFLTLIHPTSVIAETAKIGEGVIICPFVTVTDNVIIEDFAMLNFYASCGHDSKVGKYSILSPYATLNGFAVLEDEVFMGTHSTITANVKIGYGGKICANSVAMQDAPPHTFVYGVPGKNQTIFSKV